MDRPRIITYPAPSLTPPFPSADETIRLGNPLGEIPSEDAVDPVMEDLRDTIDAVVKTISEPTDQLKKLGDEVIEHIIDSTEFGAEKKA